MITCATAAFLPTLTGHSRNMDQAVLGYLWPPPVIAQCYVDQLPYIFCHSHCKSIAQGHIKDYN